MRAADVEVARPQADGPVAGSDGASAATVIPPATGVARRPWRDGALALLVTAAWLVTALYALHAMIPSPVVSLPFESRNTIRRVLPEGWGFFTRNPREPLVTSFLQATPGGSWRSGDLGSNGEPRYLFGVRRRARTQLAELGALEGVLSSDAWRTCDGTDWRSCLAAAPVVATVTSEGTEPTLCGRVGLVQRQVVPWAWATTVPADRMPTKVAILEVRC